MGARKPGRWAKPGVEANQDAVEAGLLVGLGELGDERRVDDALDGLGGGIVNFRGVVGADHADDLHEESPFRSACEGLGGSSRRRDLNGRKV